MKIAKKMPPKGLEMYILGFVSYSTVTKTGGIQRDYPTYGRVCSEDRIHAISSP
jgi:hypothetical protein